MKYVNVFLFVAAVLVAGCSGKNGDPGPKGDQGTDGVAGVVGATGAQGVTGSNGKDARIKSGSLKGTITGKRYSGGGSISESFNFEYAPAFDPTGSTIPGTFEFTPNGKYITIARYDSINGSSLILNFKLVNEGTATENLVFDESNESSLQLNYLKNISATQLLKVTAKSSLTAVSIYYPISKTQNSTYHFLYDEMDKIRSDVDNKDINKPIIFYTEDSRKVYYSAQTQALVKVLNFDNSTVPKAFPLYNGLKYNNNTFYDAATDTDLSESIQVPGDVLTVSNYKYDSTTGILSFNFTGTIAASGRTNSTHNELTITGSFNSGDKVYKDIVGRKATN